MAGGRLHREIRAGEDLDVYVEDAEVNVDVNGRRNHHWASTRQRYKIQALEVRGGGTACTDYVCTYVHTYKRAKVIKKKKGRRVVADN